MNIEQVEQMEKGNDEADYLYKCFSIPLYLSERSVPKIYNVTEVSKREVQIHLRDRNNYLKYIHCIFNLFTAIFLIIQLFIYSLLLKCSSTIC